MARSGHLAAASLVASTAILCAASRLGLLDGAPAVRVAFFALLPTVLAVNVVAERAGFVVFESAWELLVRLVDPSATLAKRDDGDAALREARAELFKAFSERLPPTYSASSLRRNGVIDSRRSLALTSSQAEVMSSSTTSKSLYEQVRENLVDHVFRNILNSSSAAADAPLYFMDPATGSFLKVNHQRKLVFTHTPDASCLFHIVKGKTHHWGFHSAIHQRYIGQNFVGRIVLTSKKLNAWEAFRVLQRRDDEGGSGSDDATNSSANGDANQQKKSGANCSPQIYLILCSARFGKGMWLAKNRRVASHGGSSSSHHGSHNSHRSSLTEIASQPLSQSSSNGHSMSSSHGPVGPDRNSAVYLSKNFANALSLVYSSDLSAFEHLPRAEASDVAGVSSSSSSPAPPSLMTKSASLPSWRLRQQLLRSSSQIPIAQGTAFQPPVLVKRERAAVHLPWILDERSSSFFELNEDNMTDVRSTIVDNCDLTDLLEAVLPAASREQYRAQAAAAAQDKVWPPQASSSSSASSRVVGAASSICAPSEEKSGGQERIDVSPSSMSATASAAASVSPSASPSKLAPLLSEWHSHPHFGYVRKLTYRPPSPSDAGVDTALSMVSRGRAGATSVRSIAIDQFNSMTIDNEADPRKLTFRTKLYTLSIPYSNCFSIETLVEFEATSQETQIVPASGDTASRGSNSAPAIKVRTRTGVFFSRETMFAPQIRRGALEGITNTCQALVELLKEMSIERKARAAAEMSSAASASTATASSSRTSAIGTDSTFISRIFALEIIKSLVSSICDAQSLPETLSTLPIQLPWKVFTSPASSSSTSSGFKFERSKTPKGSPFVATPSSSLTPQMPAATAVPFFESAPEQFSRVLEEILGATVTPRLFFDALLSDECAFFRSSRGQRQSGSMDVDVGAWGVLPKQTAAASSTSSSTSRHGRNAASASSASDTPAFVRKQVFRMPLSGVPGVEVAQLEDYQYHAFVDRRGAPESRLEFGMKLFAADLPDGDNSSVRPPLTIMATRINGPLCLTLARPLY